MNPHFIGPRRGLSLTASFTLLTGLISLVPVLASAQTAAKKPTKTWVAPHTKWEQYVE